MLKVLNLSKSFGTKQVLKSISLSVKRGEIALLLGSSGSGKSTILRILNNLEQPESGSITLDDRSLTPNELSKLHQVGMVFQQFNLFDNMTVLENITFPLIYGITMEPKAARACALDLLKQYDLADKAGAYPHNLSGGQKQRLALARTIALKPQVLCLDEPTSALDPLLTNYVAQSIEKLAQDNYIVLVASHDTKLIEQLNCTIYLLQQGMIVEHGSSRDVRENAINYPLITKFIKGNE